MYTTIEEVDKDFKLVAYGAAGQPFHFWEQHLIKNEDVIKTKDAKFSYYQRNTKKVLSIRTKGLPCHEFIIKTANNYVLTAEKQEVT